MDKNNKTNLKRKFNEENNERFYPWVKKGKKAFYELAAKQSGARSLNAFVVGAIEEKMERDTPDVYKKMQNEVNGKQNDE